MVVHVMLFITLLTKISFHKEYFKGIFITTSSQGIHCEFINTKNAYMRSRKAGYVVHNITG